MALSLLRRTMIKFYHMNSTIRFLICSSSDKLYVRCLVSFNPAVYSRELMRWISCPGIVQPVPEQLLGTFFLSIWNVNLFIHTSLTLSCIIFSHFVLFCFLRSFICSVALFCYCSTTACRKQVIHILPFITRSLNNIHTKIHVYYNNDDTGEAMGIFHGYLPLTHFMKEI